MRPWLPQQWMVLDLLSLAERQKPSGESCSTGTTDGIRVDINGGPAVAQTHDADDAPQILASWLVGLVVGRPWSGFRTKPWPRRPNRIDPHSPIIVLSHDEHQAPAQLLLTRSCRILWQLALHLSRLWFGYNLSLACSTTIEHTERAYSFLNSSWRVFGYMNSRQSIDVSRHTMSRYIHGF